MNAPRIVLAIMISYNGVRAGKECLGVIA
jgi:hypothetical protein